METRIALIGIIVTDVTNSNELNSLLSGYGQYIIGRMGIPHHHYGDSEVAIISIAIEAPQNVISALSGKLGMLNGISAKVLYAG
ncbi:MAG: iron-only hydrogenase system regulator [Lachnospiraceae bacterium]|nr:iron-only hydrogenase system regulator [Lachnospiraceae bacterium]